jgi:hypothetical protein
MVFQAQSIRRHCAAHRNSANDKDRSDAALYVMDDHMRARTSSSFSRKKKHHFQCDVKKGKRHENDEVLSEAATTRKNYGPEGEQKNNICPCLLKYRLHK